MALTAFVARSFDPMDEERIRPILNFLETFRKAGLLCEEADKAEVERVSSKVRRMIDDKDAFIGFFTRKYPVYSFNPSLRNTMLLACGKLEPTIWTPPAWVLQESGYALSAGKRLILLREDGVDFPGLQGDLEYVPFNAANPSAIFSKLSEMINDLLAKDAGREVRTEVTERSEEAEAAPQQLPPMQEEKLVSVEDQPSDIVAAYKQMQDAAEKHDLTAVREAWNAGTVLIKDGKTRFDQLAWDALYFELRYDVGDAAAIEELRRLRAENPQRSEPLVIIARVLSYAKEYEEAARLYLEAARVRQEDRWRANYLINAAQQLKELERFSEAIKIVEEALPIATGEERSNGIALLYELLKKLGEPHLAFGTAEAFLHENPQLRVRFDMALDYRRHGNKNMSLLHFKFLHERNPDEAAALHNLSLVYEDCGLSILSVSHYKRSIVLGETLSSANLGFMYLAAGMADEAKSIIQEALSVEQHDSRVEACLAEISASSEAQKAKESELLRIASDERSFLISMGAALKSAVPELDGVWKFPFGDIALSRSGEALTGSATITNEGLTSFGLLSGARVGGKISKVEKYDLVGTMTGALCRFTLTVSPQSEPPWANVVGPQTKPGFIVFAANGKSGMYAELKDNSLDSRVRVEKS
jgi:tetratricopeptide (TPR) repeat protein